MCMSQDDLEYYRRRAVEERKRAAGTDNAAEANAHLELASYYEGIVARADILPVDRGSLANQNNSRP